MSRLGEAIKRARDTRHLEIGRGVLSRAARVFGQVFGNAKPLVVADANTARFAAQAFPGAESFVFDARSLYAEHTHVEQLETHLRPMQAIAVAVGAGTINDLTKLAAHRVGRPYMCVATAASMDGYTAYGASITHHGHKQTFECPAPRAVVADVEVTAAAPKELTASGYADLMAKITAGADWIIADELGVEPIDPFAWETVQGGLREALAGGIEPLIEGLLLSGFAMQAMQSSRPASGAEHQFSHLWDMERTTDASHGFKVGVATIAIARFYETLLDWPMQNLDVAAARAAWPDRQAVEKSVADLFPDPQVREAALRESLAKHATADAVTDQLLRLKKIWPDLIRQLRVQLPPSQELVKMLTAAGAPTEPEQIGFSRNRLRLSFYQAYHIRRRFTVLDLAVRAGLLDQVLERMFET